ncbi:MAG: hypothetical protein ABI863_12065 [Ginsengibacter sp.]
MQKLFCTLRVSGLLTVLLLVFHWASAQTGTVNGSVKDSGGNPLAGAPIAAEGKRTGTIVALMRLP